MLDRIGMVFLLCWLLNACATSELTFPDGAHLVLQRFFWQDQVAAIDYKSPDGRILHVEGLSAQVSVQAVQAAASGVAEGITKAMRP